MVNLKRISIMILRKRKHDIGVEGEVLGVYERGKCGLRINIEKW